jgi:hypothetical protein
MHWPGASLLVLVGNSLLFLVAVPMYLANISKESEYITGKSLFVVFASVWIIISTNLVSIKTSGNIYRNYTAINKQMVVNASMLGAANQEFVDKVQAPDQGISLIELREQTVKINKYLEEIKNDFVFAVNNGIKTAGTDAGSLNHLTKPFSGKTTFLFFIGKDRNGKYIKIKEEISKYLDYVQSLPGSGQSDLVKGLRQEINLHDWQTRSFSRTNAFTMEYITLLQQKILLIESTIQISIIGHDPPNQEKTMSGTRGDDKDTEGSNERLSYYIY